jgi:hypothetical protein
VETFSGNKALKKVQLYEIIQKVKEGKSAANQRLFNSRRKVRDPTLFTNVTT